MSRWGWSLIVGGILAVFLIGFATALLHEPDLTVYQCVTTFLLTIITLSLVTR